MTISRETGIGFVGPQLLGKLAATTTDPARRRSALEEGERLLAEGAVSHNHFRFYRFAMEACLAAGEWAEAERHASALEEYARPEPLPWSDFWVAWGRALAAFGRGPPLEIAGVGLQHSLRSVVYRVPEPDRSI